MRLALCALAAILALAGPAAAQGDDPPSAEAREKASRHVERGRALQVEGRYGDAIKQYRAAYRLIPHPQLLYSLGQAYRLKGDKRRAVKLYKQYLERSPTGQTAETAERFVAELEREMAEERASRKKKKKRKKRKRPRDDSDDDSEDSGSSGRSLRLGGLALAGLGAVSIGVGVGFGLRASSINDELEGAVWQPEQQSRYDDGESAQRTMYIATVVGAAALLTGAALYMLGRGGGSEESQDLAVGVSADDSRASIWLRGRF